MPALLQIVDSGVPSELDHTFEFHFHWLNTSTPIEAGILAEISKNRHFGAGAASVTLL